MIFLVEAFFSGCISKLVNDGTDYSKSTIQSVIYDKNNHDFSTKIYRVIEKALNIATYNKYRNKDILYDATERLFLNFEENRNSAEAVKACLNELIPDVDRITCEKFIEYFFDGICRDDYLFKRVMFILEETGIKYSKNEFSKLIEIIKENHEEVLETIGTLDGYYDGNKKENVIKEIKFKNNKKQDYIEKWNSRLFLHIDNDERPITLADAFVVPEYEIYNYGVKIDYLRDYILEKEIYKFIKSKKTSSLIITGEPGIGKTSIISWIANNYKNDNRLIILKFRDWSDKELEKGLLKAILSILGCKKEDLENKIIILDGFDEIKLINQRNVLLGAFLNDILDYKNIKIIITSRLGYINLSNLKKVIRLLPFDYDEIYDFYKIITGNEIDIEKISNENIDVIGIPVILYMAIMSGVNLTDKTTKPELYNRIFSETGGIFDKFSYKEVGYDEGAQVLRDIGNIKEYLIFLQNTAFEMFNKNSLSLRREECQIPKLNFYGKYISIIEFPIRFFFESIENNIEFIHKTIYEYFLAEYFYTLICKYVNKSNTALAGVLADLFIEKELTNEVIEFLKYKFKNNKMLNTLDNLIFDTFQLMLIDGMTYYLDKKHKNIIKHEINIFFCMLEIIHLSENIPLELNNRIAYYIRYNRKSGLNLSSIRVKQSKIDLKFVNLKEVRLNESNLQNIDFVGSNLQGADFSNAKLHSINFSHTDLTEALFSNAQLLKVNLSHAKLIGAEFREVDLRESDLRYADLRESDLRGAILDEDQILYLQREPCILFGTYVYVKKNKKIISYGKYCIMKKVKKISDLFDKKCD